MTLFRIPALYVSLIYFFFFKGPIWKEIRGRGLAYGAGIDLKLDEGIMRLFLYRTSDPVMAYGEIERIVEEYLEDADCFDEDEFEGAKRSLIFEMTELEGTIKDMNQQMLLSIYRGVSTDYNRYVYTFFLILLDLSAR